MIFMMTCILIFWFCYKSTDLKQYGWQTLEKNHFFEIFCDTQPFSFFFVKSDLHLFWIYVWCYFIGLLLHITLWNISKLDKDGKIRFNVFFLTILLFDLLHLSYVPLEHYHFLNEIWFQWWRWFTTLWPILAIYISLFLRQPDLSRIYLYLGFLFLWVILNPTFLFLIFLAATCKREW